jgi:protein phosphatase 2C family protein 2/3
VVLIVGEQCYIANVGDSRAVLSAGGGISSFSNLPQTQRYIQGTPKIFPLSRDHKPSDELERKRIIEAGGQIYQ